MQQYTTAIRLALKQKNWVAALTLALMMPDVCGGLETPGSNKSKQRSERWFDQHMGHHYKVMRRKRTPPYPRLASDPTHTADQYLNAIEQWRQAAQKGSTETPVEEVWLSGADCYALRCAMLHEGSDQLDRQKAILDAFSFVVSRPNQMQHNNMVDTGIFKSLQLDVATFCTQIADAVDLWADQVQGQPAIQQEMSRLLKMVIM